MIFDQVSVLKCDCFAWIVNADDIKVDNLDNDLEAGQDSLVSSAELEDNCQDILKIRER